MWALRVTHRVLLQPHRVAGSVKLHLTKEHQNLKDFIFVTLLHMTELRINSFSSETFMFHLKSFGCSPLTHLQLECGTCDAGACVI